VTEGALQCESPRNSLVEFIFYALGAFCTARTKNQNWIADVLLIASELYMPID
jgi:hypothetical protein